VLYPLPSPYISRPPHTNLHLICSKHSQFIFSATIVRNGTCRAIFLATYLHTINTIYSPPPLQPLGCYPHSVPPLDAVTVLSNKHFNAVRILPIGTHNCTSFPPGCVHCLPSSPAFPPPRFFFPCLLFPPPLYLFLVSSSLITLLPGPSTTGSFLRANGIASFTEV